MMYTKPENVSYTDMCMYIDSHMYTEDFDVELVYQYLYHIVLMLARRANLFPKHRYYDDFAIYAASRIYMRFMHPKQYEYKDDGSPKLDRIKSVLNYAKNVLYPMKVDFEQLEYSQTLSAEEEKLSSFNYESVVRASVEGLLLVDFNDTLENISKTCEQFLSTIPYPKDSSTWLNIYVSVMLTFTNSVTLRNKTLRRLRHIQETNKVTDAKLNSMFVLEKYDDPILFHLDASMADYITVLSRQLKHIVAEDLSYILHTNISRDFVLSDIVVKDTTKSDLYEDKN